MTSEEHLFPRLRWLGPAWLAIYVPSYALAYGWANFLFLCNLGVVVTAVALWRGSRAWLSASSLAALPIGLVWAIDFFTGSKGFFQNLTSLHILETGSDKSSTFTWFDVEEINYDKRLAFQFDL